MLGSSLVRSSVGRKTWTLRERLVLRLLNLTKRVEQSILIFLVSPALTARWFYLAHSSSEYISKAPWYLDIGGPSLSHQRIPDYDRSSDKLDNWYDRGAKAGPAAKKFRKGACESCGALTHKMSLSY